MSWLYIPGTQVTFPFSFSPTVVRTVSVRRSLEGAVALTMALTVVPAGFDHAVRAQGAKAAAFACDIQTSERVVAVGDIHGAFDSFAAILQAAQVIDNRSRWIGGR